MSKGNKLKAFTFFTENTKELGFPGFEKCFSTLIPNL
jgi:hypothetical protein